MVVDFEDAVAQASDADLVRVPLRSRRTQVESLLRGRPQRPVTPPRSRYDVCLLVAMSPDWLPGLRSIHNLRQTATRVVVYLFDSWLSDLARLRSDRRLWSLVDDLFISFEHARDSYSRQLPCRVHYLPQAVDERWFHPYRTRRPIDVLSVGRRLPAPHRRLLELSRQRDLFYFYQTHEAPKAIDLGENQELLGRLCQSSRVHVSWSVDCTQPEQVRQGSGRNSPMVRVRRVRGGRHWSRAPYLGVREALSVPRVRARPRPHYNTENRRNSRPGAQRPASRRTHGTRRARSQRAHVGCPVAQMVDLCGL